MGSGATGWLLGLLLEGVATVGLHLTLAQGPGPDPDLEGALGQGDTAQDTAQRLIFRRPSCWRLGL